MSTPHRPRFYREPNGDYIACFGITNGWADCRAPGIAGLPSSVVSVIVNPAHLNTCIPVYPDAVPAEWLARLDPQPEE